MPRWDEPDVQESIAHVLRELRAAEELCAELPAASRDRELIERTIAKLNERLAELLQADASP